MPCFPTIPPADNNKPRSCGGCDYFRSPDYCRLTATYGVTCDTKACNRALPIENKTKRKFYW